MGSSNLYYNNTQSIMQSTVVLTDNQPMQKIRQRLSDMAFRFKQFLTLMTDVNNWNPNFLLQYIPDSFTLGNNGITPATIFGYPFAISVIAAMYMVKTYVKIITWITGTATRTLVTFCDDKVPGPSKTFLKLFQTKLPVINSSPSDLLAVIMTHFYLPLFARIEETIIRFADSEKITIVRDTFCLGADNKVSQMFMRIPALNFFYEPFVSSIELLSSPGSHMCCNAQSNVEDDCCDNESC